MNTWIIAAWITVIRIPCENVSARFLMIMMISLSSNLVKNVYGNLLKSIWEFGCQSSHFMSPNTQFFKIIV